MLESRHGDPRGDADRPDGGGAGHAGGLGPLGQDRAAPGRAGADGAAGRRPGWAAGRSGRGRLHARRGQQMAGAVRRDRLAGLADAPRSGKPRTYDAAADRRILARSTGRRPQASPAGPRHCSLGSSATSATSTSGAFCARSGSTSPGASPGASAPIPSSPPRPPTSSGCISTRPTMRSCSRWTRSRRSRRWSAPRATSSCPMAAR